MAGDGAEREVVVRITADTSDVKEKLGGVTEDLHGVAAAGEKIAPAGGALNKLGTEAAKIPPLVTPIIGGFEKLDAAATKLQETSGRGLIRGITNTTIELEALEEKLAALGGPGTAGAQKIEESIRKAKDAITAAIPKAAQFADQMNASRKAVEGADAATKLFGPSAAKLGAAFGTMSAKAEEFIGAFGKIAMPLLAVNMAIDLVKKGFEAVKFIVDKSVEAVNEYVRKEAEHANKLRELYETLRKQEEAYRAAKAGLIDFGGSIEETTRNLELMKVASGHAGVAMRKDIEALAGITRPAILSFSDLEAKGKAMGASLAGAFARSRKEGEAYAVANEASIRKMEADYRHFGQAVDEGTRQAIDSLNRLAAEQKAFNAEMSRLSKEYTFDLTAQFTAIEKTQEAYKAGNLTREQAIASLRKEAAALVAAAEATGMSAKQKTELAKKINDIREQMEHETASTVAADEATRKLAEAMRLLNGTGTEMLDQVVKQAQAWEHFTRAAKEAAHAADDVAAAQQQAADVIKSMDLGGTMEQLAGGVSKAAGGMTYTMEIMQTRIVEACQATRDEVMRTSEALNELAKSNEGMADRAANAIALLTDAWRSGMQSIGGWMQTWQAYYDQLEQLIAKNPGTKIAADMQKVVDALLKLRGQVEGGQIPKDEHVNL